jgi:DNA repair protein RecN (Recombination protein N)
MTMLSELRIRDLAIIDRLDLSFVPGFNVLTGETGAGKSIIIDAVGLLLGDRASPDVVRAGAERTEVEGAFHLGEATVARLAPLLAENGLEGDDPEWLVLAREVRANGRSIARINGRSAPVALMAEVGGLLVDVHGQGEHLSLLREREHIGLLDRYAGLAEQQNEVADLVGRLRRVRRDLESLRQGERERVRRIDLLSYQVEEISAAQLRGGEIEELDAERSRLGNAEQLAALAAEALNRLHGDDDAFPAGTFGKDLQERSGALDALGAAEQALARLARIDPIAAPLSEQMGNAVAVLDDLAREISRYAEGIEFNPRRLEQVEDRLHLIHGLQRKYGDTIEEIVAYGERAAVELDTISHAEEHIAGLEAEEERLLRAIGARGAALSAERRAAGDRLARAIEAELGDLQMVQARFAVEMSWKPDETGAFVSEADAVRSGPLAGRPAGRYAFNGHGLDTVAFLVSANPGEPLRPLVKVASGGETSRLMLALKAVLGRADETPTLIFDEIDQGIGGRVGGVVGRKLWGLTGPAIEDVRQDTDGATHQVLCITHLPQLAAYGDRHFHVVKQVAGDRTLTAVHELIGDERVVELARMIGAESAAGRQSVVEMLAGVEEAKRG